MLGLADQRQVSDKVIFTAPAFQHVLPLLDGQRGLDQIVGEVGSGLTVEILQQFVAQLDDACLIEGPRFDALLADFRQAFDSAPDLPPGASATFADQLAMQELGKDADDAQKQEVGATKMREVFDQWIDKALENAQDPSLSELPRGIIAPHIDYLRGWVNYAAIWGRLRVCDRPDRVIVVGTNHFGFGTGVVVCDKGYTSPLGTCAVDQDAVELFRTKLGDAAFEHRYDHEREHSIELQIPWIQHVFGEDETGHFPKVVGVLVHDPAVNNGESYDGNGVGLDQFIDALKDAVSSLPGKTLIVSSADLSHVGPGFGDQQRLPPADEAGKEFQEKVVKHDQEMLKLISEGKADELIAAMAWQQNPTRWCSTGNIVAMLRALDAGEARIVNYAAAVDQQGIQMVSHAAAVVA